jgi:streptogramin lyase
LFGGYGVIPNPVDGTVWRADWPGTGWNAAPPDYTANRIDKFDPKTRTYTSYPLPSPLFGARGIDASTDGKMWFGTGSGHLGRFDPATEKFSWWEMPGPKLKGTGKETGSADKPYYIWVDQFNTLGLGKDRVILTGTNSDSLLIFDPATDRFTVARIPYPLSMYARGLDGRIDDPNAGWKGRGLWVANNEDPLFFNEKRVGFLNHVQLRPDPLTP